ncbi:RluA family pseudouridine synthase [Lachnobacterium bovis]|uniref:RNA pseudouridylate synthase n=1 Tax=Lachnobacterium bovis TaxID=140626 RepID=A0A1H9SP29_9FIRM|nr:RluA family pseudouridine synthase [Lachnobacterium bovis]SER86716.1 23S rRNA pseudouridine1911/1915/1917 synthase [Lachnobacterium bovis]
MELNIIHEDEDIIVCYKPAGVATQTAKLGQQDMDSLLRNYLASKNEDTYIGIINRLDQPVEGLMLFAKNKAAAANLSEQMKTHGIGKHYYAVTDGIPESVMGTLTDYLLTDKRTNTTTVVGKERKNAKKAVLAYNVIYTRGNHAMIDVSLKTGRQHQIRVQMAHMGCPLLGDQKYGNGKVQGIRTPGLCSYRVTFEHPRTKEKMHFEIKPQNKIFKEFVEQI